MDTSADPFLANFRFLARYNRWFNARLYGACEQLPDAERRRDCGAFFGSIHGSLNHIVWGDCLWLQRFASQGWVFRALSRDLLQLPQDAVHSTVIHQDWLPRQHPAWQAMTHFFSHQTHHRGQVTTLLSQAGVDVGQTDLIALA